MARGASRFTETARGDHILRSGWERTYGWHARATEWDGRWLVLSVTVPETQRKLRHHLQNRLLWAGLGLPAPGEWLTPHAERGEQVAQIEAWRQASGRYWDAIVAAGWPATSCRSTYTAAFGIVGMLQQLGALPPRGDRNGDAYLLSLLKAKT